MTNTPNVCFFQIIILYFIKPYQYKLLPYNTTPPTPFFSLRVHNLPPVTHIFQLPHDLLKQTLCSKKQTAPPNNPSNKIIFTNKQPPQLHQCMKSQKTRRLAASSQRSSLPFLTSSSPEMARTWSLGTTSLSRCRGGSVSEGKEEVR